MNRNKIFLFVKFPWVKLDSVCQFLLGVSQCRCGQIVTEDRDIWKLNWGRLQGGSFIWIALWCWLFAMRLAKAVDWSTYMWPIWYELVAYCSIVTGSSGGKFWRVISRTKKLQSFLWPSLRSHSVLPEAKDHPDSKGGTKTKSCGTLREGEYSVGSSLAPLKKGFKVNYCRLGRIISCYRLNVYVSIKFIFIH